MKSRYDDAVMAIVDIIGEQFPDSPFLLLKTEASKTLDAAISAMRTEYCNRRDASKPTTETFDVRECPDCGRPINEGRLCPDCLKIGEKEQLKKAIALVRQHANVLPEAGAYSLKAGLDAIGRHSELLSAIVYIDEILLPKE